MLAGISNLEIDIPDGKASGRALYSKCQGDAYVVVVVAPAATTVSVRRYQHPIIGQWYFREIKGSQ